ncbi:MAG: PilZ domain-containing protein [Gammaproteobacteria bacterium]|nr:PilZ domain-containing protein [Gammaproteobacteria bacterium]
MSDKRKEPRLGIRLEVELQLEGEATSVHTRDLSNHGVFLETSQPALPAVGTIVYIKLKQGLQEGDAPLVKAQIVRADKDGIALKFLES